MESSENVKIAGLGKHGFQNVKLEEMRTEAQWKSDDERHPAGFPFLALAD